jgi:hypothetical protein
MSRTCGLHSSMANCSEDNSCSSIWKTCCHKPALKDGAFSSFGMNCFSINVAMGSIILMMTLWTSIFTFNQLPGNASLSNIDVATLKNNERNVAKLSLPSISKLDWKNSRICFLGDDRIKTKNTMAVSPKPALKVTPVKLVLDEACDVLWPWGMYESIENGYDSGKVTGTGAGWLVNDRVCSNASMNKGDWNSR